MKEWAFSSFCGGGGRFKLVWDFSELIFILDRLFLCSILRSCTRKFWILFFWFMGNVFVGLFSFLISNSSMVSHGITRIFWIYMRGWLELQCKQLYYIRNRRNRSMEDNHLSDSPASSIWEQEVSSKRSLQLKKDFLFASVGSVTNCQVQEILSSCHSADLSLDSIVALFPRLSGSVLVVMYSHVTHCWILYMQNDMPLLQ